MDNFIDRLKKIEQDLTKLEDLAFSYYYSLMNFTTKEMYKDLDSKLLFSIKPFPWMSPHQYWHDVQLTRSSKPIGIRTVSTLRNYVRFSYRKSFFPFDLKIRRMTFIKVLERAISSFTRSFFSLPFHQPNAFKIFELKSPEHNHRRIASACSTIPQAQRPKHLNNPKWCFQNTIKQKHVDTVRKRLEFKRKTYKKCPVVGKRANCFHNPFGSDKSKNQLGIFESEKVFRFMTAVMSESRVRAKRAFFEFVGNDAQIVWGAVEINSDVICIDSIP